MTTPWYEDPITQAHGVGGEQGVDFGTPYGTPLTAILGGTVQAVDCSVPWRCEVDISTQINGQSYIESFLHVDQPMVTPGESIGAGSEIGLSGGQLAGGVHPDSPSVSTGPHTEFDLFRGTSPWQNPIDPTAIAQGGPIAGSGGPSNPIGNLPIIGGIVGAGLQAGSQAASGGLNINFNPWGGFQSAIGGTFSSLGNWTHDRAVPFVGANVIALVVAAAILLVIFGTGQGQGGQQQGGPSLPAILPIE